MPKRAPELADAVHLGNGAKSWTTFCGAREANCDGDEVAETGQQREPDVEDDPEAESGRDADADLGHEVCRGWIEVARQEAREKRDLVGGKD